MKELLTAFAEQYARRMDDVQDEGEERSSINHPIVFIFLGDEVTDALSAVCDLNAQKWHNSKGVVYLHVYSERTVVKENVFSWRIKPDSEGQKDRRPSWHKALQASGEKLSELNVMLREMYVRIAEYGRLYPALKELNVAVVARADDPATVLLPDLSVLVKSVFNDSFRALQLDLFALLQEGGSLEGYEYASSMGLGFFMELDRMQQHQFEYQSLMQVTQEGLKMLCKHGPGPLFDLVYVLSDKNENGIIASQGQQGNYELISHINLLKNKQFASNMDHGDNFYNNQQFKKNLGSAEDGSINCYASAGLSQIKRPQQAIALTVLNHLYSSVLDKLQENSTMEARMVLEKFGIDRSALERSVRELLPEKEQAIEALFGIIHQEAPYERVKQMTVRQAEEEIFGKSAWSHFDGMVRKAADEALSDNWYINQLEERTRREVLYNPLYGSYAAYRWTDPNDPDGAVAILEGWIRETGKEIEQKKAEREILGQERVDLHKSYKPPLMASFSKKARLRYLTQHILRLVYSIQYEIDVLEILHKLLVSYTRALEELHERTKPQFEDMSDIRKNLFEMSRIHNSGSKNYLTRNIHEYYEDVVSKVLAEWEQRRGKQAFFEDRGFGSITRLLDEGKERLVARLIEIAERDMFTHQAFHQSFEDELLNRANAAVSYESESALTKEGLFRDLYETLERDAAIHIDSYQFTVKTQYEEKYYFGHARSEFIQYAFTVDEPKRSYKIGRIPERKKSGVEKLNLRGGFRLEDLVYYQNARKFYAAYKEHGYQFHAEPFLELAR
jgi:hypothetical protein